MSELLIAVLIAISAVLGGAHDQKSLQTLDSAIMELHAEIKEEQKEVRKEERMQAKEEKREGKKSPARLPGMPWGSEA